MDSRTIKIRKTEEKLRRSRTFIKYMHNEFADMYEKGTVPNKSYWIRKAFDIYEDTK